MNECDGCLTKIPVRHPYYATICEHCDWRGSSEQCGIISYGDDADMTCPACLEIFLGNETGAIMSDFTTEEWKDAGDGFIYATRPHPGLGGKLHEENIFDFKINSGPPARPGETEANVRLILQANKMYGVIVDLISKMDAAGDKQNWRDQGHTYCGFLSEDFNDAREVLEQVDFAPIKDQK